MSGLFKSPQTSSREPAPSTAALMASNQLQNQALQFSMLTPMMLGGAQAPMQYMKGNTYEYINDPSLSLYNGNHILKLNRDFINGNF